MAKVNSTAKLPESTSPLATAYGAHTTQDGSGNTVKHGSTILVDPSGEVVSPATQETLSQLNNKFSSLGRKAGTASIPVTLDNDQNDLLTGIRTDISAINEGFLILSQKSNFPLDVYMSSSDLITQIQPKMIVGKLPLTASATNTFRVCRPETTAVGIGILGTAQTLTISSSSAADTSAGTGARTVTVEFVRYSTMTVVTGEYTLNGNTPVTITTDGHSINSIIVSTTGTGLSNAGIIYGGSGAVATGKPANVLALVEANKNQSNGAVYTVSNGSKLYIVASLYSPSTVPIEYELRIGRIFQNTFVSRVVFNSEFQYESRNEQLITVNGGETVWVAASATGTTPGRASVSLKGYLVL